MYIRTKVHSSDQACRRHINADRLRRGKKSTKVGIDNADGSHEGVGGDNRVQESIDGGKGRAAVLVPTSYSTSILSPPIVHLTLLYLDYIYLIPLLLHHPLKISGVFGGMRDRK